VNKVFNLVNFKALESEVEDLQSLVTELTARLAIKTYDESSDTHTRTRGASKAKSKGQSNSTKAA
jgi:hypothetical protein